MNGRLYRSRRERMIAGVAGGLADYLDVDPSLVRIVWAVLTVLSGGVLLVLYVVMAIVVPEEPLGAGRSYAMAGSAAAPGGAEDNEAIDEGTASPSTGSTARSTGGASSTSDWRASSADDRYTRWGERRERRGAGGLIFGLILIVVGGLFLLREYLPGFDWDRLWPIALIALGAVLVLTAMTGRGRRDRNAER